MKNNSDKSATGQCLQPNKYIKQWEGYYLCNTIMKYINDICKFVLFLFLLYNLSACNESIIEKNKNVECRLYWIGDSYPEKVESIAPDAFRIIKFHYLIINNTSDTYFLPIRNNRVAIDNEKFCSEVLASIDNKPITTLLYTDTRWKGVLKPQDSIYTEFKIPEWVLDSAGVNKRIKLQELIKTLKMEYNSCKSDTIYSKFSIADLLFTKNDTIAMHYKKTNQNSEYIISCP